MSDRGRGEVAMADMRARIQAGWDLDMLWARMSAAEQAGKGYVYDYAPVELPAQGVSVED